MSYSNVAVATCYFQAFNWCKANWLTSGLFQSNHSSAEVNDRLLSNEYLQVRSLALAYLARISACHQSHIGSPLCKYLPCPYFA